MMPGNEYIEAKQRMLLVAEVSDLMLRTPDKLRFDDEMFALVMKAMASNRDDVRTVFAEMDMLRASLGLPVVPEGVVSDAAGGSPVESVRPMAGAGGSQAAGADAGPATGEVPDGGSDGKRTKRPKPRRNKKGDTGTAKPVDPGDMAG
jgi:hypothetical protein